MSLSITTLTADLNNLPADDLLALRSKSLRAIERLLDDPQTSPTVRLRAALAILSETRALAKAARPPAPARPEPAPVTATVPPPTAGNMKGSQRNLPCPCGSGIKYKRCCGADAGTGAAAGANSLIQAAAAKLAAFSNSGSVSAPQLRGDAGRLADGIAPEAASSFRRDRHSGC